LLLTPRSFGHAVKIRRVKYGFLGSYVQGGSLGLTPGSVSCQALPLPFPTSCSLGSRLLLFIVVVALPCGRACLPFVRRRPYFFAFTLFAVAVAAPLPPMRGSAKADPLSSGVPPGRQAFFISGCSLRSRITFPHNPSPGGVGARGRGDPDRQKTNKTQQKPLKKTATTTNL